MRIIGHLDGGDFQVVNCKAVKWVCFTSALSLGNNLKQISEQCQKDSVVTARREVEQQCPGDEGRKMPHAICSRKMCLTSYILTHGFSRKRRGKAFYPLHSSPPAFNTKPVAGQRAQMRQVFVSRKQSSRWIPSKIRGETRWEAKSIWDGWQWKKGTEAGPQPLRGGRKLRQFQLSVHFCLPSGKVFEIFLYSSNKPPCKGSGWLQLFPVCRADVTGFVILKADALFAHQQCPALQSGVIAEWLLFLSAAYGRVGSCKGRELSFLAHCAANCRSGLRITEL